ncbi:hypothetical protein BV22DRAFT_1154767 [Leucogyrophana mollusca]|uniref:Uncharacterized protein n=1 Tax=Leucogyrophana mollusca TaxID=85980 RepID=A0ACB8BLQ0_9AGAM|nr:hypothetical protein BV22DRAFT_1154767 [Leucogyrophana mollusca]
MLAYITLVRSHPRSPQPFYANARIDSAFRRTFPGACTMHLLNTETLQFEEPQHMATYAILSHVWGEQEVTFRDTNKPSPEQFKGYAKIEHCCAQALADGYKYLWIDTCCIDKSSGAELSEATDSMYRWYAEARMCYAYLEDVLSDDQGADFAGENCPQETCF